MPRRDVACCQLWSPAGCGTVSGTPRASATAPVTRETASRALLPSMGATWGRAARAQGNEAEPPSPGQRRAGERPRGGAPSNPAGGGAGGRRSLDLRGIKAQTKPSTSLQSPRCEPSAPALGREPLPRGRLSGSCQRPSLILCSSVPALCFVQDAKNPEATLACGSRGSTRPGHGRSGSADLRPKLRSPRSTGSPARAGLSPSATRA